MQRIKYRLIVMRHRREYRERMVRDTEVLGDTLSSKYEFRIPMILDFNGTISEMAASVGMARELHHHSYRFDRTLFVDRIELQIDDSCIQFDTASSFKPLIGCLL